MRTGDNDEAANIACRQLGYASGMIYTFGHTHLLPTLPIVTGWKLCDGSQRNILGCQDMGQPNDRDCAFGCAGPDGLIGTDDDTIDASCTHAVDQGAICMQSDSVQSVNPNLPRCSGCGAGGCALAAATSSQPITFSCVEYYTTNCVYDITQTELANNMGSYLSAMRAFAACANVQPEPEGYCHGTLLDASKLANHEVCQGSLSNNDDWRSDATQGGTPDHDDAGGAITDIGFHIR